MMDSKKEIPLRPVFAFKRLDFAPRKGVDAQYAVCPVEVFLVGAVVV